MKNYCTVKDHLEIERQTTNIPKNPYLKYINNSKFNSNKKKRPSNLKMGKNL